MLANFIKERLAMGGGMLFAIVKCGDQSSVQRSDSPERACRLAGGSCVLSSCALICYLLSKISINLVKGWKDQEVGVVYTSARSEALSSQWVCPEIF